MGREKTSRDLDKLARLLVRAKMFANEKHGNDRRVRVVHAIPRGHVRIVDATKKMYFLNKNAYISVFCSVTYAVKFRTIYPIAKIRLHTKNLKIL